MALGAEVVRRSPHIYKKLSEPLTDRGVAIDIMKDKDWLKSVECLPFFKTA